MGYDDDRSPSPSEEDNGESLFQTLNVADFDINNREQYFALRSSTPRIGTAPRTVWNLVVDHGGRLDQERALYQSLLSRGASLPPLRGSANDELDCHQLHALFVELEHRGIFDELWGSNVSRDHRTVNYQQAVMPTRRQMWDLMRDLGYGFGPRYGAIEDEDEDEGTWTRVVWLPRTR